MYTQNHVILELAVMSVSIMPLPVCVIATWPLLSVKCMPTVCCVMFGLVVTDYCSQLWIRIASGFLYWISRLSRRQTLLQRWSYHITCFLLSHSWLLLSCSAIVTWNQAVSWMPFCCLSKPLNHQVSTCITYKSRSLVDMFSISSETAFFDPSMLALLYFPEDQK